MRVQRNELLETGEADASMIVEGDEQRRMTESSATTHYHEFVHPNQL